MTLSDDERRALALLAALLVLAAGARWLERPRLLLDDVPALDLEALESASRAARPAARVPPSGARPRVAQTHTDGTAGNGNPAGDPTRPAARVDPNTATADELATLPGVGPSLAARIIADRAHGPFATVSDLERVRGIGPALAARLAPHVTVPALADRTTGPYPAASPGMPPGTEPPGTEPPGTGPPGTGPEGPVDLNAASQVELQRLPGVGPVLAARLVARRDSLGGFGGWDEVDAVAGVGPAMLARLQATAVLRPRS